MSSGEKIECAICREELKENVETTVCGHQFHTVCLNTWTQRGNACPLCKHPQMVSAVFVIRKNISFKQRRISGDRFLFLFKEGLKDADLSFILHKVFKERSDVNVKATNIEKLNPLCYELTFKCYLCSGFEINEFLYQAKIEVDRRDVMWEAYKLTFPDVFEEIDKH
jgi:hypothetical protein